MQSSLATIDNFVTAPIPAADFKVLWASPVTKKGGKTRRKPEVVLQVFESQVPMTAFRVREFIIREWGVLRNLLNTLSDEHEAGLQHHELMSMAVSLDLKSMIEDYIIEGASNEILIGLSIAPLKRSHWLNREKPFQTQPHIELANEVVGISNPKASYLTAFYHQTMNHVREKDSFQSCSFDLQRITGLHGISSQDYPKISIHLKNRDTIELIILDNGIAPHVLVRGRYTWRAESLDKAPRSLNHSSTIQPLAAVKLKGSPHEIPQNILYLTLDNFMQALAHEWVPHRTIPDRATAWCEWLGRQYDPNYSGKKGTILNMYEINRLEHELFLKFFHLSERNTGAQ